MLPVECTFAEHDGDELAVSNSQIHLLFQHKLPILYPRLKVHGHMSHTLLCSARFEICHMSLSVKTEIHVKVSLSQVLVGILVF